ncbi:hypothetical protein BH10BAC5_BH10BAC5_21490 [soil metagenome]
MKKNYLILFFLCLISYVFYIGAELFFTHGHFGVPLDDSWIHFVFARNFAHEFNLTYNPGEPTAGTTSPLWVIVSGLFSYVSPNFLFNAVFLSAVFHLLSVFLIYRISLFIFTKKIADFLNHDARLLSTYTPEKLALLTGILVILTGRFEWAALSGMETTMFTAISLWGIYASMKETDENRFTVVPSVIFGLATVSRPEGFLLFAFYILITFILLIKENKLSQNILKLFLSLIIFLLISTPYLYFSYKLTGNFLPNTFRGQNGGFNFLPNLEYLRISFVLWIRDNAILSIFYLSAFYFYIRKFRKFFGEFKILSLLFLWTLGLPVISSVVIPNWRHHVRYQMPLIPLEVLIGIICMFWYLSRTAVTKLSSFIRIPKAVTSLLIIVSLAYYMIYAGALGKNTDNINSQQVYLANWIKKNIPHDQTIALNDIGAIKFIAGNRVIDMAGLVTPEILENRKYNISDQVDSMYYLLKRNDVRYLIIYDDWFKAFLEKYGNKLEFVTSAILEDNTICGGVEMKVYRAKW